MSEVDGEGVSSWRRAGLTYQEKFVNDYVFHVPGTSPDAPPLRIAQAPSASAAKDILLETETDVVGGGGPSARGRAAAKKKKVDNDDDAGDAKGRDAAQEPPGGPSPPVTTSIAEGGFDGDDDDAGGGGGGDGDEAKDPIPATAYTIWDAGILLGNYVTQAEVWRRLVGDGEDGGGKVVVLELGAGTGVAGLTVAASGLAKVVAMSDLPDVVPFLRHNASRNKRPVGPIPRTTAMAVVPLRWGIRADAEHLPGPLRAPHIVLGADLIYTEKTEVIDALVTTLDGVTPVGSVAVFASCTDHRPESIAHFERQLSAVGFDSRVVHPGELRPGFGGGGGAGGGGKEEEKEAPAFRVLEMRRVRRGTS